MLHAFKPAQNDVVVTLHLNFVYVHRDWRLLQYMHVYNKRSNIESVVYSLSYDDLVLCIQKTLLAKS